MHAQIECPILKAASDYKCACTHNRVGLDLATALLCLEKWVGDSLVSLSNNS